MIQASTPVFFHSEVSVKAVPQHASQAELSQRHVNMPCNPFAGNYAIHIFHLVPRHAILCARCLGGKIGLGGEDAAVTGLFAATGI